MALALSAGGLLIGLAFGFIAARTNFCVMGAIADKRNFDSSTRLAAVAIAIATALVSTQVLDALGLSDLSRSMYLAPRINWLGAILGGMLFGAGMVYAGGCASRTLVRAGGGDLRSLLVLLVLATSAFATISGVLASGRVAFEDATALNLPGGGRPSLDALLGDTLLGPVAGGTTMTKILACAVLIVPLGVFALLRGGVLRNAAPVLAGVSIGGLVALGWLLTGLAYDEMAVHPATPQSLSFVRPVADAVDFLERSTALGLPGFGASSVFGTLLGSLLASLLAGGVRVTGFTDRADILRHTGGALAMGIGGVFALGCSIGQGIAGVSTLSLQSLIAAASIFVGAWLALARLERNL